MFISKTLNLSDASFTIIMQSCRRIFFCVKVYVNIWHECPMRDRFEYCGSCLSCKSLGLLQNEIWNSFFLCLVFVIVCALRVQYYNESYNIGMLQGYGAQLLQDFKKMLLSCSYDSYDIHEHLPFKWYKTIFWCYERINIHIYRARFYNIIVEWIFTFYRHQIEAMLITLIFN